jgi:hypothetical protein
MGFFRKLAGWLGVIGTVVAAAVTLFGQLTQLKIAYRQFSVA